MHLYIIEATVVQGKFSGYKGWVKRYQYEKDGKEEIHFISTQPVGCATNFSIAEAKKVVEEFQKRGGWKTGLIRISWWLFIKKILGWLY